jgi:methylenetetrahydrofolate dehydrogenase (NADP+)/methenyltetrahydrofolate cyclohydrolase
MYTIKEFVKLELDKLKNEVENLERKPSLTIIKNNSDPASDSYVKGKLKDSEYIGINTQLINTTEVSSTISKDASDALILQLPCDNFKQEYIELIPDYKDVDGFKTSSSFEPCTPLGIILYLNSIEFDYESKNAVVIGRSDIVGKPIAKMLLDRNMNVTILHSKTKDEDKLNYIKNADLIVVATGKINTLKREYLYKKSCIVIDVGINRNDLGQLVGDCERNLPVNLQTPVPGGVGLLTRLALMKNVVKAAKNKI